MNLSDLLPGVLGQLQSQTLKAQYRQDPVLWAKDILDEDLWSAQREILYSIRDNRNTAVAAGHGVGKSHVSAIAMMWWIHVHPVEDVFVASTAPFQSQISAIMWNNMRQMHAKMAARFKEGLIPHKPIGYITGDNQYKTDQGIIIGQGRRPPTGSEDSGYQGLHAKYLFAVGDEAAGLSQKMVDALGNITTGEFCRRLLIANPTDPASAMAMIWHSKSKAWNTMHISVLDNPRISGEEGFPKEKMSALTGIDYVEDARRDWGEDDPRYVSRVLGQWAFDAGNTVYSEAELALAANTFVLPDPSGTPELGVDVARMGGDSTFVYRMDKGEVWETDPDTGEPTEPTGRPGVKIRLVNFWSKAPLTGSDPNNLGTAERVDAIARELGANVLKIDASGIGGGVIDGLNTLNTGSYVVVEIFGGARPTDKRQYVNSRAEGFFDLKKRFRGGEIDLDATDEKLLDEFRGMLYEYSDKGPIKIESKDSMKRRGKKSPDRADAFWYAAFDASPLLDGGLSGMKTGERVMFDPYQFTGMSFEGAGLPI